MASHVFIFYWGQAPFSALTENGACGAVEKPVCAVTLSEAKGLKPLALLRHPRCEIPHFVRNDTFSTAPLSLFALSLFALFAR